MYIKIKIKWIFSKKKCKIQKCNYNKIKKKLKNKKIN